MRTTLTFGFGLIAAISFVRDVSACTIPRHHPPERIIFESIPQGMDGPVIVRVTVLSVDKQFSNARVDQVLKGSVKNPTIKIFNGDGINTGCGITFLLSAGMRGLLLGESAPSPDGEIIVYPFSKISQTKTWQQETQRIRKP